MSTIYECFNLIYEDKGFLQMAEEFILNRGYFGDGYYYGTFPDVEEQFEGVKFYTPSIEEPVFITEEELLGYAKDAFDKFLDYHPEHTSCLNKILEQAERASRLG